MTTDLVRPAARAFVSYARADGEAFATNLRLRLEREHPEISLWQDRARMEGGIGWWKQITDALEHVQILIMVMTPAAAVSEVARKEWRYARQQGARVCPVIGDPALDFGALPSWMRKVHFYDLAKEWDTFVTFLRTAQKESRVPFMAPDLRDGYVPRVAEFRELASQVLNRDRSEPLAAIAALQGGGGFGKTTLATALCHDDDVISAFDDGILWVTLGHKPNVPLELTKMYAALTGDRPPFVDAEDAAINLAMRLEDKNCLIVLDDVWNVHDAEPFLRGGGSCARVVTTRQLDVLTELRAARVLVDEMTGPESVQLLLGAFQSKPANLEPVRALARRLGEWPLLLRLAASQLRSRTERGDSTAGALSFVNRALDKRGAVAFDRASPAARHDAVATTLGVSLELLKSADRRRCIELSIFANDRAVPVTAVRALWGLDDFETEALLGELDAAALLNFDLKTASLRMHDVCRAFFGSLLEDAGAVHRRLVETGWPDPYALPDPYAWRWYSWHVAMSGGKDKLRPLLFDHGWMDRKQRATEIHALVHDYDLLGTDAAGRVVQDALRLSSAALSRFPEQLPTQLTARLPPGRFAEVDGILSGAAARAARPWLKPLHRSLTPPGGPLVGILKAHAQGVDALALSSDGRWAVSGGRDWRLRLWQLDTGRLERTFDNGAPVSCVAFMPDGSHVVSGSEDRAVRAWNLESGEPEHEHRQHTAMVHSIAVAPDGSAVYSISEDGSLFAWSPGASQVEKLVHHGSHRMHGLAVTPDGRFLVYGSGDTAIAFYDLEQRAVARTIEGHTGVVRDVALSRDGRQVASGAEDLTVRLWNFETGAQIHELEGHSDFPLAVAFSPDGTRLFSGSADRSICVWEVAGGALRQTFEGHAGSVRALAAHPDGTRLFSASGDRTVRVWETTAATDAQPARAHVSAVSLLAVSSDGRSCVSGGTSSNVVRVWSVDEDRVIGSLEGHQGHVLALAMSADGTRALTGSADQTLRLWDVAAGRVIHVLKGHTAFVFMTVMTPDGSRAVSMSRDRTVRVWDLESGKALLAARRAGYPGSATSFLDIETGKVLDILRASVTRDSLVALCADGKRLVFTCGSSLMVWDLESGSTRELALGDFEAVSLVTDPGGRVAVLGSRFGAVGFCDLDRELTMRVLTGHITAIRDAVITADRRAVTASRTALRTWDLESGRELSVWDGIWDKSDDVAISPSGEVAYAVLGDTVSAAAAATGRALGSVSLDHTITSIAVAGDSRILALGDESGRVHFLRLES
jgi:WD40 repeat protein